MSIHHPDNQPGNRFFCYVFLAAVSLFLCIGFVGCDDDSEGDPEKGDVLTLDDGASMEFPPGFSTEDNPATFEKVAEATGTVTDDRKNISAEYLLTIDSDVPISNKLTVTIPLAAELIPGTADAATIAPEYFNETAGTWIPIGGLKLFDAESNTIKFDIPVDIEVEQTFLEPSSPADESSLNGIGTKKLALRKVNFQRKYRVSSWLFTSALRVNRQGSKFTIVYYPASLNKSYSVKSDDAWNSNTGNAADPEVEDFIEDLDAALNQAYQGILTIQSSGGALFAPLYGYQFKVYVTDTGDAAGDSPLGGSMSISNSRIESWEDLLSTAAHELVHVFQGQYYLKGKMGGLVHMIFSQHRWFIESTAHYFASLAINASTASRSDIYRDPNPIDYLSVPITAWNDSSMYAVAHFLDWIGEKYGTPVVADVLKVPAPTTPLKGLANSISKSGEERGLSMAFQDYGRAIATKPEGFANMHRDFRNQMEGHSLRRYQLSAKIGNRRYQPSFLNEKLTFITFRKKIPLLSMGFVDIGMRNNSSALLVIDAPLASGSAIEVYTYDVMGETDAVFEGRSPIDDYSGNALTVKDCGRGFACTGFTQIMINTDMFDSYEANNAYYILVPPVVTAVAKGSVTFSTKGLGNIPPDYIKGYNVLRPTENGAYLTLNESDPIDLSGEGEMTYKHDVIQEGDAILVQVVDKHNHVWPETVTEEAQGFWMACSTVEDGVSRLGCVKYEGVAVDSTTTEFINDAMLQCILAGFKRYQAVSFESEPECKSWLSGASS